MLRESGVHFTSWPFFFANRLVVHARHRFLTKWDQTKSSTVARSEFGMGIHALLVSKQFLSTIVCALNCNNFVILMDFKGQSHALKLYFICCLLLILSVTQTFRDQYKKNYSFTLFHSKYIVVISIILRLSYFCLVALVSKQQNLGHGAHSVPYCFSMFQRLYNLLLFQISASFCYGNAKHYIRENKVLLIHKSVSFPSVVSNPPPILAQSMLLLCVPLPPFCRQSQMLLGSRESKMQVTHKHTQLKS